MVFDDAVAILSYASPYNVNIQLEKWNHCSAIQRMSSNLNANKNLSSNTDKSLLHPLYRSHSVDNLRQITKEMSLSEKSTSSVGRNVINKIKTQILNRMSINAKTFITEQSKATVRETSDKDGKKVDQREAAHRTSPHRESPISTSDKSHFIQGTQENSDKNQIESYVKDDIQMESSESQTNKKPVTPPKRKGKAPQPPVATIPQNLSLESLQNQSNGETIETKAQVHNEEVIETKNQETNDASTFEMSDVLMTVDDSVSTLANKKTASLDLDELNKCEESSDLPSLPNRANSPQRVQSPTGKTKSSSMSDLTNNNRSDKLQSVLLERAVSLDMDGHNLPEENLYNLHGKNLVLNDDSTDSMPIITWSMTKQIQNEFDSSESTLNEINQALINTSDLSIGFTSVISDPPSDGRTENKNSVEDNAFVSNIQVLPLERSLITSTPLKNNSTNQTFDSFLALESSSSSEKEDQTLAKEDKKIDLEISHSEAPNKEVIELSENELNDVMMSHKDFLMKKANVNKNGSHQNFISVTKTPLTESQYESLDFESWSYVSEDENSNLKEPSNNSSLYKTALDTSLDQNSNESIETRRLPEVAGITLKTGDQHNTNSVLVSSADSNQTHDLHDSFSSSSSSPSK